MPAAHNLFLCMPAVSYQSCLLMVAFELRGFLNQRAVSSTTWAAKSRAELRAVEG